MGTQQLLLIILGTIVVGVAVIIAFTIFHDDAISSNRDSVTTDLVHLGVRAQQYFRRPQTLGGGGNSFAGLTPENGMSRLTLSSDGVTWKNANGSYSILNNDSIQVTLKGLGFQKRDGSFVEVHCRVTSDSIVTAVIH